MIFSGCKANSDVTCLQVIVKKEVIEKNSRGARARRPLPPTPKSAFAIIAEIVKKPCEIISKKYFKKIVTNIEKFSWLSKTCDYKKKLLYVILGLFTSDPLEKKFGKLRQGCGAAYFITVQ